METRAYNVYKFDELSPEAQEKAIDNWYKTEDYLFLKEDLLEELKQLDEQKIFIEPKLSYSLNNCQGDGLSFSCQIDFEAYLKWKEYSQEAIDGIKEAIYKFCSTGNKGRYCFASRNDIDFEINDEAMFVNYSPIITAMKLEIEHFYLTVCKKLEKYGYSVLEYRMNTKEFSEFCEFYGYMFRENGQLD